MRNLDSSEWLEKPELVEIKAVALNNNPISEFGMNVRVKRAQVEVPVSGQKGAKTKKDKAA